MMAFLAALAGEDFASPLTAVEFALLQAIGVFRRDCRYAKRPHRELRRPARGGGARPRPLRAELLALAPDAG